MRKTFLSLALFFWAAIAQAAPAIDGTSGWTCCGTGTSASLSLTLSTSNTQDAIFLVIGTLGQGFGVTVTDTAGLVWQKRAQVIDPIEHQNRQEEWFASSAAKLTSDTITITMQPGINFTSVAGVAFGVSGAQFPTPFDPLFNWPTVSTAGGTMSVSTLGTDDLIFAHYDTHDCSSPTPGAGWTPVVSPTGTFNLVQYKTFAAAQTNLPIPASGCTLHNGIAEALVAPDGLGVLEQNSKDNTYVVLQTGMETSKQNMYIVAVPGIGTSKLNGYAILSGLPNVIVPNGGRTNFHAFPP